MRDVVASNDLVGICTNQPKSVNMYAKEVTEAIFNGRMDVLINWEADALNVSKEIWLDLILV